MVRIREARYGSRANPNPTVDRILTETVSIIAEGGERAVTMAAVAGRAGVSRNTIYYHFKDVADLIDAAKASVNTIVVDALAGKSQLRNPYIVPGGIGVDDEKFLTAILSGILQRGCKHELVKGAIEGYRAHAVDGRLQEGVDPDTAALLGISMVLAEYLALTLGSTREEKRDLIFRLGDTMQHLAYHGVFKAMDPNWREIIRPTAPVKNAKQASRAKSGLRARPRHRKD